MQSLPRALSFTLLFAPFTIAACGGDAINEAPKGSSASSASSAGSGSGSGSGGNGTGGAGGNGTGGAGGNGTGGAGGNGMGGTGGIGTGGAGGDGGNVGGAGGQGGAAPLGEPIVANNEEWTWVPFDDAFCADGSTTGIGVNLSDKSKNVIIYLMGGGACWDNFSCYVINTAANLDGYGEAKFQSDAKGFLSASLFDRNDPENPAKDFSYVFIPYCTGDVHGGNKVADYNGTMTRHVGFANVTAYLKRIIPTFPDAARVLLSGSSAGGFGAALNWWRTQEAFGDVRVDLIDDSGPSLPAPYLAEDRANLWRDAWNLNAALPPDCVECVTKLDALIPYYGEKFPNNRSALLSYTQDQVISYFYGPISTSYFEEGLKAVTADPLESISNLRYFYIAGTSHVLLNDPTLTSKGVVLKDWLNQMLSDDPAWASVNPWTPP